MALYCGVHKFPWGAGHQGIGKGIVMKNVLSVVAYCALVVLLLSSCGQKGALYLPKPAKPAADVIKTAPVSPAPDPTAQPKPDAAGESHPN